MYSRNADEEVPLDKVYQEAKGSFKNGEDEAAPCINNGNGTFVACSSSLIVEATSPESNSAAGGEVVAVPEEVRHLYPPRSKIVESSNAHGILVGEIVNIPKMDLDTKPPFESCLVPCQVEGSHDALAVGFPMQPKNDNILHLASLDSAELLDTIVAQPLLAGGAPEDGQLVVVPYATHYPPAGTPRNFLLLREAVP